MLKDRLKGFLMRRYQLLFTITKIPVAPPKKQDPTENADNKGKNEPREDQSSDDTQPIQMTVKVQKKKNRCKKRMLPKTGEKKHSLLIYSGGFLSVSTIITWIWRRKRG